MGNNIIKLPGKIDVSLVDGAITQTINKTWSELKSLRDNSQLIPGLWYRITDYTCTTAQENTQSAGHVFDIIVRADKNNVLNENAYAAHHAGDTYFANSKLETWELKYCLDNDTTRFAWADSTNGKGIIYYMKDEANNECPYDFKNIQYRLYKTTDTDGNFNGYWAVDTIDQAFPNTVTIDENDYIYAYTFTYFDNEGIVSDLTLSPFVEIDGSIYNNKISPCVDINSGTFKLNCIVFVTGYNNYGLNNNIIEEDCLFLTFGWVLKNHIGSFNEFSSFGDYCSNNTFGLYGHNNTFGQSCSNNTFGQNCFSNKFTTSCSYNTFGYYCSNNKFGLSCSNNTFGQNCFSNIFEQNCSYNTFGYYCSNNKFGLNCSNNTFNICSNNTFGLSCSNNTFEQNCSYNTFTSSCSNNTFEQNCSYNTFGQNCYYNTFGQNCSYNTFAKAYSYYIIIENGNKKITLTSTQTVSSSNLLRNIKICQGVNNTTTTTKTISHNTVNDTFQTEYKPANSQVILV